MWKRCEALRGCRIWPKVVNVSIDSTVVVLQLGGYEKVHGRDEPFFRQVRKNKTFLLHKCN